MLATGNQDKTTRLWDRRTWRCLATLPGNLGAVRSLRFSSDGRSVPGRRAGAPPFVLSGHAASFTPY